MGSRRMTSHTSSNASIAWRSRATGQEVGPGSGWPSSRNWSRPAAATSASNRTTASHAFGSAYRPPDAEDNGAGRPSYRSGASSVAGLDLNGPSLVDKRRPARSLLAGGFLEAHRDLRPEEQRLGKPL